MRTLIGIFLLFFLAGCSGRDPKKKPEAANNLIGSGYSDDFKPIECTCIQAEIVNEPGQTNLFMNSSVELISYKEQSNDNTGMQKLPEIIKNGEVIQKFSRRVSLTPDEEYTLEKIIYNRKEVCSDGDVMEVDDCAYTPLHAIIFYNDKNEAVSFIEFSFWCGKFIAQNEIPGNLCGDAVCEIAKLFRDKGFENVRVTVMDCERGK